MAVRGYFPAITILLLSNHGDAKQGGIPAFLLACQFFDWGSPQRLNRFSETGSGGVICGLPLTKPLLGEYSYSMAFPLRTLSVLFVILLAIGCRGKPLLHYSLDTPPLVLLPASHSNVRDGRGRFREIYCAIREDHGHMLSYDRPCEEVLLTLAEEPTATGQPVHLGQARSRLRVLVVPGLFSECIRNTSKPYTYALAHLEEYGYKTGVIEVSGRSSSAHNAAQIKDALLALDLLPDEKVVLVGYSKGTPDILEALVMYPEVRQRTTALVSIAGVVSGTPFVDSISAPFLKLLEKTPVLGCPRGDGGALESLKRSTRLLWLSRHQLPQSIRYFSLGCFAERDDMSAILRSGYDKLARVDPRNDSQVIFSDMIIPGSTLLGFVKADHWAIAMPFAQDTPILAATMITRNEFPREVLLEAVVRFVEEKLMASD